MQYRHIVRALTLLLLTVASGQTVFAEEVGKSSVRHLHCMGQSWKITVRETSQPDVVMLRADDQALFNAARALGQNLSWSPNNTTLTGEDARTLALGQRRVQVRGEERSLETAPQVVDGAVHVPTDGIEGILDCRLTVKPGSRGAIYMEPVLKSISFINEDDDSLDLQVKTSVPVRKKVFTLKNPDRTVVDLVGVTLPKDLESVTHPAVGEIRLGQFTLAPSVTRIVIPSDGGLEVGKKRTLDLFEHQLSLEWPPGRKPSAGSPQPRPTVKAPTVAIKAPTVPIKAPTIKIKPVDPDLTTPSEENPDERPQPSPTGNKQERPTLDSVAWAGNRLKLSFSQPVSYRWARVNSGQDRFLVDFPGVIFPQKKTSLGSAVPGLDGVRIVQNMPEPQPVVRLVCDLRSPIAVDTEPSDDKVLYLSFPGRQVSSSEFPKGVGHTSKEMIASGNGRTICIDPGHGGSDPGALNRSVGVNEKQVTLDISLRLAKLLKQQGWNVILTRQSDRDVSWAGSSAKQELGARAQMANRLGADLFVSIHANASVNPEIHGTSIHWYKSDDYQLARLMETGVMSGTGRKNRGLVKNRFYVLAHTQMPAVLVETAFLTNYAEGRLLADPDYRDRVARGIASGLQLYAGRMYPATAAKK